MTERVKKRYNLCIIQNINNRNRTIMNRLLEKNNALDWYKYGLERNDDFFSRFIMHWIAFNWLYAECNEDRERDGIRAFCRNNAEKLRKYDAFSTEAIKVFLEEPVKDSRSGLQPYHEKQFQQIKTKQSITDLFLSMYQVRCNLFHGSKSIYCERDVALVRASAELLEGYLRVLLFPDQQ